MKSLVLALMMGHSALGWAEISEPAPVPQLPYNNNGPVDEYTDAKQLMRDRKWAEAIVLLRSALKKSPHAQNIELDLARSLVYSGRREEALTVLSQMMSHKKGAIQKELIRRSRVFSRIFLTNATFQTHQDGVNLLLVGKYRAAREKFEKALELDPSNVETLTRLSQCLVLEGDMDSAAERLRVARRLNPYEPEIRLWLGRALQERGEVREGLTELKSAYQELPSSELAAVWYAEALFSTGQKFTAIQILDEGLRRYPNHVWELITLSRYRLMSAPAKDSNMAWQARKDLQLALSRIPLYLPGSAESAPAPMPGATVSPAPMADSIGDLALNLRKPEADLKREIQKLMEEADSRIEGDPAHI